MSVKDAESAVRRHGGGHPALHPTPAYRPDIQGLRGIAVLLVVLYHAWPENIPGGFIGVDVFFVISGFLITGLLLKELQTDGHIDFLAFYARRMRRLLPASLLVTCVTFVAFAYLAAPFETKALAASGIAATTYLSNFWFAHLATDYLQGGSQSDPFLHTWSLAVEEQFYLVWPAVLFAVTFITPAVSIKKRLLTAMLLLSAVSLAACIFLTVSRQPWAFFASPTRAWEFSIGGMAALWRLPTTAAWKHLLTAGRWTGIACMALAAFTFSSHTRFPGIAALLPVAGAYLIVAIPPPNAVRNGLAATPLTFVGDISYSWYLWHWPLMVMVHEFAPNQPHLVLAAVLGSLLLAWLSYRYVENPVRRDFLVNWKSHQTVALGLTLTVTVAALGLSLRTIASGAASEPAQVSFLSAHQDRAALYADNCNADFFATQAHPCEYGDNNGKFVVVLFGDSHAAQWFSAVEQLAIRERWRLVVLTKSSCPPIEYEPFNVQLQRVYVECTKWRESAFEQIARLRPQMLVIANSSRYTENLATKREQWRQGMNHALARMALMSPNLVIIRDPPTPGFDIPQCLARAAWRSESGSNCHFVREDALDKTVLADLHSAVSVVPNAFVIDLNRFVCPNDICQGERNGKVLYMDSNHLTATFIRELAPQLFSNLPASVRTAGR